MLAGSPVGYHLRVCPRWHVFLSKTCPAFSGAFFIAAACPCDDHIDAPAPALAAHQPRLPIRDGHLGTIALGHVGWVWLDPLPAIKGPQRSAKIQDAKTPVALAVYAGTIRRRLGRGTRRTA